MLEVVIILVEMVINLTEVIIIIVEIIIIFVEVVRRVAERISVIIGRVAGMATVKSRTQGAASSVGSIGGAVVVATADYTLLIYIGIADIVSSVDMVSAMWVVGPRSMAGLSKSWGIVC